MLYAIAAVLALIADQWMKYWVTANIVLDTGSVELIPGVFKLVNIHNEGAAFSLLAGWRWIFVLLAVVFTAVIVLALAKNMIKGRFGRWTAVLTAAGAIGNCIDRVMYGYVVDMFVIEPVKFIQVFNIADLFITICGILFCVYLIFGTGKNTEHAEKKTKGHTRHGAHSEREPDEERPRHSHDSGRHSARRDEPEQPRPPRLPDEEPARPAPPQPRPEPQIEPEPRPQPEPQPQPESQPQPQAAAAKPAPAPDVAGEDEMSFSLDDIMNEFK